jgi:hypothetical protein
VKTQRQAPSLLALLGLAISVPARLPAQESITADRIARHIEVLAHDSLRGRATPSPGLDAAARYVAAELRRAGLRPAQGTDLVVRWPLVTRQRIAGEIRVVGTAGDDVLVYGTDFAVMAAGIPEVEGQLVPDADLRDSAAIRGRIPLLRLSGDDWHGSAHAAARVARRAGALAVVLVLDSAQAVAPVAAVGIQMDHSATAAPAVLVTPAAARRLLAGKSPAAVSIRIPERADTALVPYVLGVLPGRDARLRDEYVVVSAHLDHLGVGTPDERGDSLYNGADDNASGVAALVEMAHALARVPSGTRRSVLFFATSAEELCLCGSEFFTRQPSPPLSALVADLNLDGIGRSWQQDTVSAEGSRYSSLGRTVRAAAAAHPELRLTVVDDQWPDRNYFLTSDQIWFARRGVPGIFLSSTGPDRHYHRPSDETATIEPGFTARIARLAAWTVRAIADDPARPAWEPEARAQLALPR